ncbi:PadR family transcriptional regulator, partial [Bacillus cereus]|nr:PadR family transcriptional regulator [Bacillus cereus]
PALGELPLDQWIELIYLHEQRHMLQIKEIKLLCEIEK